MKITSFSLLLFALTLASLTMAFEVEAEIGTGSHHGHRPRYALYACTIKSKGCRKSSAFSDLDYAPGLTLTKCHSQGLVSGLWSRYIWPHDKRFYENTYYVTAQNEYSYNYVHGKHGKPSVVKELLDRGVKDGSNCDADIDCYHLNKVDHNCEPL